MSYALLAYNHSIHSFTKCKPVEVVIGHYDPRDPFDIDLSSHLLQQYIINHKDRMTMAYKHIHELYSDARKNLIDNRNKNRDPEIEYSPEQQILLNPPRFPSKLASRCTQDIVMADLPMHIYTKKNKVPLLSSARNEYPKQHNCYRTLLVLHFFLHPTFMQEIKLKNLNDGPGILPFKIGHSRITSHYHSFLQTINLQDLQTKLHSIQLQVDGTALNLTIKPSRYLALILNISDTRS
jgi:hypothetical protein